jgi:DNA-binding NtrC family response regulator
MMTNPAVLLGLRASGSEDRSLRVRMEGWVRRCGYRTRFTDDAHEAISWLGQEDFAATFVDSDMGRAEGEALWRRIRPAASGPQGSRRVVLMAREQGRNLWFEALRNGVVTVLPFPPREAMVQAALRAATRGWAPDGER